MQEPLSRLQQQAAIARAANQQRLVHQLNYDERVNDHAIALGHDANVGLDLIQMADGSIQYAASDTNGVRGVGDTVLAHQGISSNTVDAMPYAKKLLPIRQRGQTPTLYPIKVLFSIVKDGQQEFYIGGDRSTPVLIVTSTDENSIAFITNQGKTKSAWVAGIMDNSSTTVRTIYGTSAKNWVAAEPADLKYSFGNLQWRGGGFWTSTEYDVYPNREAIQTTTTGTPQANFAKFDCQGQYQYGVGGGGDYSYLGGPCSSYQQSGDLAVSGCNTRMERSLPSDSRGTYESSSADCWEFTASAIQPLPSPGGPGYSCDYEKQGEYNEYIQPLPERYFQYPSRRKYLDQHTTISFKSVGGTIKATNNLYHYQNTVETTTNYHTKALNLHQFMCTFSGGGFPSPAWNYKPPTFVDIKKDLSTTSKNETNWSYPYPITETFSIPLIYQNSTIETSKLSYNLLATNSTFGFDTITPIGDNFMARYKGMPIGGFSGTYESHNYSEYEGRGNASYNYSATNSALNITPELILSSTDATSAIYSQETYTRAASTIETKSGCYANIYGGIFRTGTEIDYFGTPIDVVSTGEYTANSDESDRIDYFLYLDGSSSQLNNDESFVCSLKQNLPTTDIKIGDLLTFTEYDGSRLEGFPSIYISNGNYMYRHYHPNEGYNTTRFAGENIDPPVNDLKLTEHPFWTSFIGMNVVFAKLIEQDNKTTFTQYKGKIDSFSCTDNSQGDRIVHSINIRVEKILPDIPFDSKATANGTLYSNHNSILNVGFNDSSYKNINLVINKKGNVLGTIYVSHLVDNLEKAKTVYVEAYDLVKLSGESTLPGQLDVKMQSLEKIQVIKQEKPIGCNVLPLKQPNAVIQAISYYS